jgi:pimeloyl-ACP methyl ester carboxylesterase
MMTMHITPGFLRRSALAVVASVLISSGPSLFAQSDAAVTPFKYEAQQRDLDDLKQRLKQTRWPERETVGDWSQGVPLAKLQALAPSLPGFGFSDKPTERGWNAERIAKAWSELMRRLGYTRYVAQGGDWGSLVTTTLAQQRPAGLAGIHLNMPFVFPDPIPTTGLSAAEQRAVDAFKRFQTDGFGYFQEQSTRPQTIGYTLADSPAGQAAWIYEKFHDWTDNNGDPESALSRDEMLDNITLYWLTDTAASSARMYFEHAGVVRKGNSGIVDLQVGCSIFPREIVAAPRSWAEPFFPNLIYWHEVDRGGHFAAFEQPALFAKELRECFRSLREIKTLKQDL